MFTYLELENARLENKVKKQMFIDKYNDQMIVNQLSGVKQANIKVVTRKSGMNQVSQIPTSQNQSSNEVQQSQVSQRIQISQSQIQNYQSLDKNYQTQKQ
ncbi:unnamed protein product [Paramecium sonneborni]|uniref:Uncharacterized protein n=1 Tax=Paramecium sonneborni TaxID=65129 RepID=A0A8S1RU47_9CILI|nr:unnamed protein product [Paramecium sonneborni]